MARIRMQEPTDDDPRETSATSMGEIADEGQDAYEEWRSQMHPFEIFLAATGDRAYAETAEDALFAADTLVRDHCDQQSSRSLKRCRETLIVSENGSYQGITTELARAGLVIRNGVGGLA